MLPDKGSCIGAKGVVHATADGRVNVRSRRNRPGNGTASRKYKDFNDHHLTETLQKQREDHTVLGEAAPTPSRSRDRFTDEEQGMKHRATGRRAAARAANGKGSVLDPFPISPPKPMNYHPDIFATHQS